jgi:hypothetical protein
MDRFDEFGFLFCFHVNPPFNSWFFLMSRLGS